MGRGEQRHRFYATIDWDSLFHNFMVEGKKELQLDSVLEKGIRLCPQVFSDTGLKF